MGHKEDWQRPMQVTTEEYNTSYATIWPQNWEVSSLDGEFKKDGFGNKRLARDFGLIHFGVGVDFAVNKK